jgi:hypothetical protein
MSPNNVFVEIRAMRSHLTQWIEEADARQFCQIASWNQVSATTESHSLHLGETILKVPRIVSYALACARRGAGVNRDARPRPDEV